MKFERSERDGKDGWDVELDLSDVFGIAAMLLAAGILFLAAM